MILTSKRASFLYCESVRERESVCCVCVGVWDRVYRSVCERECVSVWDRVHGNWELGIGREMRVLGLRCGGKKTMLKTMPFKGKKKKGVVAAVHINRRCKYSKLCPFYYGGWKNWHYILLQRWSCCCYKVQGPHNFVVAVSGLVLQ